MVAHTSALRRLRARFGQTWKECGDKKLNAQADHRHERVEDHWLRMVTHKLIKRFHHLGSQLLKEIKQIKRHLD